MPRLKRPRLPPGAHATGVIRPRPDLARLAPRPRLLPGLRPARGPGTPSRGLDLAAEYIAAQFRRAGLEPIGDDGYFQTARWREAKSPAEGFAAALRSGEANSPQARPVSLRYSERAIEIKNAPLVKVSALDPEALKAADPAAMKGKVVLFERPDPATVDRAKYNQVIGGYFRFLDRLADDRRRSCSTSTGSRGAAGAWAWDG